MQFDVLENDLYASSDIAASHQNLAASSWRN